MSNKDYVGKTVEEFVTMEVDDFTGGRNNKKIYYARTYTKGIVINDDGTLRIKLDEGGVCPLYSDEELERLKECGIRVKRIIS